MSEIKVPEVLMDIVDDHAYYAKCMREANDLDNIPRIVRESIPALFGGTTVKKGLFSKILGTGSPGELSQSDLELLATSAIDRLYRRLTFLNQFDKYDTAYFKKVITALWLALAEKGIKIYYVLDNSLGQEQFKFICAALSAAGVAVVTPYSRNFKDESDGLFDMFDRDRMKRQKPSTAFAVENQIMPIGFCPDGHFLEAVEVEALIYLYMKIGRAVAYIEKDASVNYLERMMTLGENKGYIQVFRNQASSEGEFAIKGKQFKDKDFMILDAKAP